MPDSDAMHFHEEQFCEAQAHVVTASKSASSRA